MSEHKAERRYTGQPISAGIAIGPVAICDARDLPDIPRHSVDPSDVDHELARLAQAVIESKRELKAIIERVAAEIGEKEADIFRTHLVMLDDPSLRESVEEKVTKEGINVEAALGDVIEGLHKVFSAVGDVYIRERALDISDIGRRLLSRLVSEAGQVCGPLAAPSVVAAGNLTPAITVHLDRANILGFVTEAGGVTSHAAILARSLGVPAVSGLKDFTTHLRHASRVLVDGFRGEVIIDPSEETVVEHERWQKEFEVFKQQIRDESPLPAVTTDGHRIQIMANLGRLDDVNLGSMDHFDGVGLYRTEYQFLTGRELPSEEAQFKDYKTIAEKVGDKGVNIRVLDIGGDKALPYLPMPKEANPFLGWRGLRFLQDHPDIFRTQLRAILRASVYGKLHIMYPMINTVEELLFAREMLQEAEDELAKTGEPFDEEIQQGIMVETAAAVETLDLLLRHADFLSVGSNDLVQYLLTADRTNERVARYYEPREPAVMRALKRIVDAAAKAEKSLSICGEIAGSPGYTHLLVGMGYPILSMNVIAAAHVKHVVRTMAYEDARKLAEQILSMETAEEIKYTLSVSCKYDFDVRT